MIRFPCRFSGRFVSLRTQHHRSIVSRWAYHLSSARTPRRRAYITRFPWYTSSVYTTFTTVACIKHAVFFGSQSSRISSHVLCWARALNGTINVCELIVWFSVPSRGLILHVENTSESRHETSMHGRILIGFSSGGIRLQDPEVPRGGGRTGKRHRRREFSGK